MAEIKLVERRSAVLNRPTLPCLAPYHTINLTAGCLHGCRYCYAQSFRSHPGAGRLVFYANTLDILRRELPRKRVRPRLVYFSTACEPFQPSPEVRDCLYGVMELLLAHSVSLLISTKAEIPGRFLRLFGKHVRLVHVQVGLTTIDDRIRQTLEPGAATVEARLATLHSLLDAGVDAEARMDPLVPGLTDTVESFERTCESVAGCGARSAAASYLFLRRTTASHMGVRLPGWSFREACEPIYTDTISNYCGGSEIRVPSASYRRIKYDALQRIGASRGVEVRLCRCKNPGVTEDCCHPTPTQSDVRQTTLWEQESRRV